MRGLSVRRHAAFGLALAGLMVVAGGASGAVELLEESEGGVLLRFTLPEPVREPVGDGLVILSAPGLSLLGEEGAPALPEERVLIALPPEATARAEIVERSIEKAGRLPIAPVPRVDREGNAAFHADERFFGRLYPEGWIDLSRPGRLRDQRVVSLSIRGARSDLASGRTEILRSATIRIRFSGGRRARGGRKGEDRMGPVYRRALLNHRSAAAWRERRDAPRKSGEDSFASSANWIRLAVSKRGLQAVTYDDLVGAGIVDPRSEIGDARTIRLFSGGGLPLPEKETAPRAAWMREVKISVAGEEDGSFDPGDRIEFFGLPAEGWMGEFDPEADPYYEHLEHPLSWFNYYWLTWGGSFDGEPARMASVGAGSDAVGAGAVTATTFPDRIHAEENIIKDITRFGEDGWFWDKFSPTEFDKSFFVWVPGADSTQEANVKIRLYHYADKLNDCGTERARFTVNGITSGTQEWNSCTYYCDSVYYDTTFSGDSLIVRELCGFRHIGPYDFDSTATWIEDQWNRFDIEVAFRMKVYLAWIEVGYERFFRADDGTLHFRFEDAGEYRVPIAGFGSRAVRAFDVTDPFDVKELSGLVSSGDSTVLHVAVGDPATYQAVADTAWITPDSLVRVVPANLRDPAGAAEYLVICYDPFASAASDLLSLRSSAAGGGYSTRLVKLSDVYNEFSWGLPDAAAVRNFLSYAYHNWGDVRPVFALLLGDATSDAKGITGSALETLIPTHFRIDPGGGETSTYATDDYFSYVDPDEGDPDWAPDIAVGRLPVNDLEEAETVVSKIVAYESDPELGPWRNRFLFLADDEIKRGQTSGFDCAFLLKHTDDTEKVADILPETYDRQKVYMVEYPLTSAYLKPLAKEDYIHWIGEGFLLSNYLGHGAFDKMADEALFVPADAQPEILNNGKRLHLFTAFSCSIGSFDLLDKNSLAEVLLKMQGAGSVGSFSSDAPAFAGVSYALNAAFVDNLAREGHVTLPIGLAALAAKAESGASRGARKVNDEKYTLLGDPALRLGIPELDVRFQGGEKVRFERGSVDTLFGEVVDSTGVVATWFDGLADVSVWGMADTLGYTFFDTACTGRPEAPKTLTVSYGLNGPTFFRGTVDVSAGRFEAPFFVPRDTRVGDLARASVYVQDDGAKRDGSGGDDSVRVEAEPPGVVWDDEEGPSVRLTVDGTALRDGISFDKNALFQIELEDESGINLQQNDNYYTIHIVFDRGRPVDLSSMFAYDNNSYKKGGLSFRLADLTELFLQEGAHEFSFRAADNLNNRTVLDFSVFVVSTGEGLSFHSPVLNYPNPFDPEKDGVTKIQIDLTRTARVAVRVVTPTGKRIRAVDLDPGIGFQWEWDGRDQDGDVVANGVYFVRVTAETEDGSQVVEQIGKAVVLRGAR